ncbi:GLPGLI family protein [Flavobacterium agricola]|uniref:GLPGLI family protein n=1 Tax=Flavobacterium agricola TaxID=2870839 RepID=A0ABY6LYU5_9FLAO|nr:GLPGLI family protein [Flavobacterium agricola]UYW00579.1 GLPGLI family protein [Flavobacterium agricola]
MKKKILLLLMLVTYCLQAQTNESFTRYTYELTYTKRLDSKTKQTSICYLDVYKNKSIFGDKYLIEFQNIWTKNDTLKDRDKRYNILADAKQKYSGQAFSFIIEKENNKFKQYNKIWTNAFYVIQNANEIIWHIEPQTIKWNNYTVQQATAFFEGRNWTVLFTKEIALNNGPYKFTNLPGFVVKAWDSDLHYTFEFINSEKITEHYNYLARINQYQEVTLPQYQKLFKNHYNKTYRAFWGESQTNVEQMAIAFPLDKKIGEVENPIDLSYKQ